MIIVEFCQTNMANGTRLVFEQLEQGVDWADVEVMEYDCLGNCELCGIQPFAMVEGEIVVADRPESLLEEIKAVVKNKEELDRQWRELGF